jgi:hypothetical protein
LRSGSACCGGTLRLPAIERCYTACDFHTERLDLFIKEINMSKLNSQEPLLMRADHAREGLIERRYFAPEAALRQGGHRRGIGASRDYGLQHRPCRDAHDVRGDGSEFDVGPL